MNWNLALGGGGAPERARRVFAISQKREPRLVWLHKNCTSSYLGAPSGLPFFFFFAVDAKSLLPHPRRDRLMLHLLSGPSTVDSGYVDGSHVVCLLEDLSYFLLWHCDNLPMLCGQFTVKCCTYCTTHISTFYCTHRSQKETVDIANAKSCISCISFFFLPPA